MLRRLFVLSFVVLGMGCGSSETKITPPSEFLPPTASADAGGGSAPGGGAKNDTSSGEKEKFVP
ncbi:MAG: hypothetical protein SFV81_21515 [Pirellulaceae bacterium]|nr:hypothetical protein [Pirellulaceae bacterium]